MTKKRCLILPTPIVEAKSPMELPSFWRIPQNYETEPEKVVIALRERIKELNCLYGISQLADQHPDSLDNLFQDLVNLLPPSWQYPEITCARIIFQGKTFKTRGFKVTRWRQSSPILVYNERAGEVTVFYLEERPAADEGPFLREERALLDAVAERISHIAMRLSAEEELQEINRQLTVERKALQESQRGPACGVGADRGRKAGNLPKCASQRREGPDADLARLDGRIAESAEKIRGNAQDPVGGNDLLVHQAFVSCSIIL